MFTRGNKYRAQKTVVDGQTFDSKAEAYRYVQLRAKQKAGEIYYLDRQVPFVCRVNGVHICTYVSDFIYFVEDVHSHDGEYRRIIEDVKGFKTPVYRLKKKLVEALYGCTILEVTPARPRSTRRPASGRARRPGTQ